MRRALAVLTCFAAHLGCAPSPGFERPSRQAIVAIIDVAVVDVRHGGLLPGRTVVTRGGRIVAVGPTGSIPVPDGAEIVDGAGRFLSPGFADMHVHLYTDGDLFTYVANGVTTVRNMAGDSTHLAMRRRAAAGEIIASRVLTAGPVVEAAPLSHPDNVLLDDPSKVRSALTHQRTAGYDFVKVYNGLAPAVYDSVTAVSRQLGMSVAGHVPTAVGLSAALSARQRSIEHFRGYERALLPDSARLPNDASFRDRSTSWIRTDTANIASLVARTVAQGVWNCPTFTFTVHELSPNREHRLLLARPEIQRLSLIGLPADRSTSSYLQQFTDADYDTAQRGLEKQFRLLRALDEAGAGLLVGTDSWLSGYAYVDEMELMVRAGLSPARVIRMATLDAARFLGEETDWGTVAVGRRADLVLLDADPLLNVANARRVSAVIVNGRLLRRAELDRRLGALPSRR